MTEDSPSRTRGYGPFPEGAEPTAPLPAHQPAPTSGAPAADSPVAPVSPQIANVPPSAQNGETAPTEVIPGPGYSGYDPQATVAYPPPPPVPCSTPSTEVTYPSPALGAPYAAPGTDPGEAETRQETYPPGAASPHSGAPTSQAAYPDPSAQGAAPAGDAPGYPAPAGGGAPEPGYPGPSSGGTPAPGYLDPTSGSPYPTSGGSPAYPTSGGSAYPTSGSGAPSGGSGAAPSYGPFHGGSGNPPDNLAPDPYDFSVSTPFTGRRIEPSPPPDRRGLLIGIVAGLVAGLLVFGIGGWFAGRATAPKAAPKAAPTATPRPTGSLGVFEQSQAALNQPHFAGTGLVAISQGWLPYLASCSRSGEPGGPALNAGEKARVRCTIDGMSAIFVEYGSISDRDKARVRTLGQNVDARALTPGVGAPTQRATPSGRTNGNYVEYAYKLTEGGVTRPVAAIWWDDAQTPVAGYLLAYWKEGLGESWDPMRDLWARYA